MYNTNTFHVIGITIYYNDDFNMKQVAATKGMKYNCLVFLQCRMDAV